jgi:hypothetical protein
MHSDETKEAYHTRVFIEFEIQLWSHNFEIQLDA